MCLKNTKERKFVHFFQKLGFLVVFWHFMVFWNTVLWRPRKKLWKTMNCQKNTSQMDPKYYTIMEYLATSWNCTKYFPIPIRIFNTYEHIYYVNSSWVYSYVVLFMNYWTTVIFSITTSYYNSTSDYLWSSLLLDGDRKRTTGTWQLLNWLSIWMFWILPSRIFCNRLDW